VSRQGSRRGSRGAGELDTGRSNAALSAAERTVLEAKRRGSDAVIEVMRQYPADQAIQAKALQALLQLCCHEQTTTAAHLSEIGAVELVVNSMEVFPTNQNIQQDGVGLLWSLSANVNDETKVRNHGGVAAVVKAMQAFPGSTVMQHRGCGALFNLSNTVATRGDVAAGGAVEAVLNCYRNHLYAQDVMQQANLCMNPLADHDGNKVSIAAQGGISLIIESMKAHAGDEIVQRHACGALHVLCAMNSKNKVMVREAAGIPQVIACMHRHMHSPKLLQRACGVLWNVTCLSMDTEVLTSEGWMDYEGVKARVGEKYAQEQQSSLQVACYELRSRSFVYRAISSQDFVEQSSMKPQITFEDSDNNLSVCVTNDHDMWAMVQQYGEGIQGFSELEIPQQYPTASFSRCTAGQLVEEMQALEASGAQPAKVSFIGHAEEGFTVPSDAAVPPFVTLLGLESEGETNAFLQLYGVWLSAAGSLDAARQTIVLSSKKGAEERYVDALFAQLSRVLPLGCGYRREELGEQVGYTIVARNWWELFAEYTRVSEDALNTDGICEQPSKWLFAWVLREPLLSGAQLRMIVKGLCASSSSLSSDEEGVITTTSPQFRDDLQQLLLMAGFSCSPSVVSEVPHSQQAQWQLSFSRSPLAPLVGALRRHVSVRVPSQPETTWCVNVPHPDHLIAVRRRLPLSSAGMKGETLPTRAVIVGNCNNDANKLVVVSLSGIDALVEAMRTRMEHQGIQREACGALRNLSLLAANKALVGKPPVIQAVLEAMRHHLSDADIQEQACVLLYSVCDTPEIITTVISSGGVEAVIAALKTHGKKASVLEEGFGLLYKLARTGMAQPRDPSKEAIGLATKAIQSHSAHDGVRKYAQGMISEWNSPSYAERFAKATNANANLSTAVTPAHSHRGSLTKPGEQAQPQSSPKNQLPGEEKATHKTAGSRDFRPVVPQ
jgi:hypothetical protein